MCGTVSSKWEDSFLEGRGPSMDSGSQGNSGHSQGHPTKLLGKKALQEVRRHHSGVAYRLFQRPRSNFPCFTTQTGFLMTLLEMASVNPTVPWYVICALSWLNRHLFMSFWKTHTTNGFLNSQPCTVNVGSIWGSGEKERAVLFVPN